MSATKNPPEGGPNKEPDEKLPHKGLQRIFDNPPATWRDLQDYVARTFVEIGCDVQIESVVRLPRGTVSVDVLAHDLHTSPSALYVCEYKLWARRPPKSVVHAFRTVVAELGANVGFLISKRGFQSGAREAAAYTNVRLLTWREFESSMFDRWLANVFHRLDELAGDVWPLMSSENAEALWKGREYRENSYDDWTSLCRRYPLIAGWGLLRSARGRVIDFPKLAITDGGLLSEDGSETPLDTWRKVFDAMPVLCRKAHRELSEFWHSHPSR